MIFSKIIPSHLIILYKGTIFFKNKLGFVLFDLLSYLTSNVHQQTWQERVWMTMTKRKILSPLSYQYLNKESRFEKNYWYL